MAVTYDDEGHIARIECNSIADAKLIIKEIKLKKREYTAQKKQVSTEMAEVRARLRSHIISMTPPVRLSGTIGKVTRGITQASKVTARAAADREIRALEAKKAIIEDRINRVDSCVLQLERYVLEHS
jgi:hypothetical protein